MTDRHPKDPRNDPRHRERGPRAFFVCSYPEIARTTGLAVGTLRKYVSHKVFDPFSLGSVSKFVAHILAKQARRAARKARAR